MSEKRNSWTRRILSRIKKSPITKIGEKVGAPIRKPIQRYFKLGTDVRSMMRKYGLSGSVMGRTNYNKASGVIRGFLRDNNTSSAIDYAQSQKEKINK